MLPCGKKISVTDIGWMSLLLLICSRFAAIKISIFNVMTVLLLKINWFQNRDLLNTTCRMSWILIFIRNVWFWCTCFCRLGSFFLCCHNNWKTKFNWSYHAIIRFEYFCDSSYRPRIVCFLIVHNKNYVTYIDNCIFLVSIFSYLSLRHQVFVFPFKEKKCSQNFPLLPSIANG